MDENSVNAHYGISGILDSIIKALEESGKNIDSLQPSDLAPIDEFHTRGKESTIEITNLAQLESGHNVLDVGCGLGGSARYIANEYGCSVTGIDLTDEYIDVAKRLTDLVNLSDKVSFRQGSAIDLPFDSDSFDLVWTEHTQMNISDKSKFYGELSRVLKPGGRLVFHDVFGTLKDPFYPTPWAEHEGLSSLFTQDEAKEVMEKSNLTIDKWRDTTKLSLQFFLDMLNKTSKSGSVPLGIHLLMGSTAKIKFLNQIKNLEEDRISIALGTALKN